MSEQPGKAIAKRQEDPEVQQAPLQLLTELIELEKKRVAGSNTQAEVARESLRVSDKENQRRYDFNKERITLDDAHRTRSWGSKTKMIWTGIVVGVVVLAIMLWVAFLGDDGQRQTAITLTGYLLSGGGFFGLGYFLGSRARS